MTWFKKKPKVETPKIEEQKPEPKRPLDGHFTPPDDARIRGSGYVDGGDGN